MTKSSDTAPGKPAKTVTTNAKRNEAAPPAVPSSPSADTHGGAGTSTAEGPSRPKADVPSPKAGEDHEKPAATGKAEVPPPGERVDDEHEGHGDKKMTRQE